MNGLRFLHPSPFLMHCPAALRTGSRPPGLSWLFLGTVALVLVACDASGPSTPTDASAPPVNRIPGFSQAASVSTPGPAAAVDRTATPTATATLPVADGWTLLSVPLDSTAAIEAAFPTCASAFVYEPGAGYQSVPDSDALPPGRGAFLNCTADTASVSGPVPDPTVPLSAGWNLIGPHAQAIAASDLSTDPGGLLETSFFKFDPGTGYAVTDSLHPGNGYWVKADEAGTLLLPTDNQDRITVTFNPRTVGNSLFDGGSYSGTLDYTVSTDDTTFTTSGSTTADIPISDGDNLEISHNDSEYISTFAVNNTATEQPPFQTSGFPDEPDYQSSSTVSIPKSDVVSQYQIRAIPSTSPEGFDTQSEYSGELFEGRWTNRDGYDEVLGIVTTTRIDNEEDVPQSVIDKMNTAYSAAASQMPFPITQTEKTFSEVVDIATNSRGVNFNYTGIDGSSPTNILNTSDGYADRGRSTYGENQSELIIKSEIYSSLTGIEKENNIFSDGGFNNEARFLTNIIYSLNSQSDL